MRAIAMRTASAAHAIVRPCALACTAFGLVLALLGFAAIVIETPPDAMLVRASAASAADPA